MSVAGHVLVVIHASLARLGFVSSRDEFVPTRYLNLLAADLKI